MGSIRPFNPVKLFVGVLLSDASWSLKAEQALSEQFGPVDLRSELIPFTFSDYYRRETGDAIQRIFFAFEQLIEAEQLPEIKIRTNDLEASFSTASSSVPRPVNLDPGYVEHSKVILASTKNFYHRIYLGQGIFGEVTLHFKNNGFQFFPWTYPDYQSERYQSFFLELRAIYRKQLRAACQLRHL
jgi:hypothetical protein